MSESPAPIPRKRPARSPGRPSGEPGEVRAQLLDAAVRRFAQQGIGATSLRDIAAEAGVTPALVHYYFGGKDALQAAVIEEKVMPLMQRLREPMLQSGHDLRALVPAFVRAVIGIAMENPWLPQLWVREVLQDGGLLRSLMLERIGPMLPRAMAMRFAQAQGEGALNPRIDPRLLVASIMGQTMFLVAAAPIWRRLFDADDVDADALCRHVLALLESGLELSK